MFILIIHYIHTLLNKNTSTDTHHAYNRYDTSFVFQRTFCNLLYLSTCFPICKGTRLWTYNYFCCVHSPNFKSLLWSLKSIVRWKYYQYFILIFFIFTNPIFIFVKCSILFKFIFIDVQIHSLWNMHPRIISLIHIYLVLYYNNFISLDLKFNSKHTCQRAM